MLTLLAWIPRWMLLALFTFGFGWALGQVTAHRTIALQRTLAQVECQERESSAPTHRSPLVRGRPR